MKLKLKVSKTLKRNLKEIADAKTLERKVYIKDSLLNHISENKEKWADRIDGYEEFVITRSEKLKVLKQELSDNEDMSAREKQANLRSFYKEHFMFLTLTNKNRKLENIIVDLDDQDFYALQILAENKEQTIETYAVELLQFLK